MPFFKFGEIAKNDYVCIIFEIWMLMAEYRSKYRGEEVDALLDKIAEDNVGDIDSALSLESENPVMNKVITEELNKKVNKTNIATINGQTLTDGGNIEVSTDAYDDTEIKGKLTELQSKVGNLSDLETTDKTSIVNAINEVSQGGGSGVLTLAKDITLEEESKSIIVDLDVPAKSEIVLFIEAKPNAEGSQNWTAIVFNGQIHNDIKLNNMQTASGTRASFVFFKRLKGLSWVFQNGIQNNNPAGYYMNTYVITQNAVAKFMSVNDSEVSSITIGPYQKIGVGTRIRIFIA